MQILKDWHLALGVLLLVLLDLTFLLAYTIVMGVHRNLTATQVPVNRGVNSRSTKGVG